MSLLTGFPFSRSVFARRMFAVMLIGVIVSAFPAPAAEKAAPVENKKAQSITFDKLKLDMKKEDPYEQKLLTEEIKKLDGKKIRIRGFILPFVFTDELKKFVLVRDNQECCFGPGAAIFDCINVEMTGGQATSFTSHAVMVEGKFKLKELPGPDGKPLSIYHLDADSVK